MDGRSEKLLTECSGLGRIHVGGQSLLRNLNKSVEGGDIVDGQLGEHAAINLNTGQVQALDETVVGHALCAGSSVDALDPQATEVALLRLAVTVGVHE